MDLVNSRQMGQRRVAFEQIDSSSLPEPDHVFTSKGPAGLELQQGSLCRSRL